MKLKIPPPIWLLIFMGLAKGLDMLIPALNVTLPAQRGLTYGLIIVGFLFALPAVRSFFVAKTTVNPHTPHKSSTLVTGGVFQLTRNPMYLGLLFILTGWCISLANLTGLAVIAGFIALITAFQIKPEEEMLQKLFGEEYAAYCRQVRRWI